MPQNPTEASQPPLDPAAAQALKTHDVAAAATRAPLLNVLRPNEADPAAVAMALCPYAQGPLLEWHLLDAFAHLLSTQDQTAAQEIRAIVRAALPTDAALAHDFAARLYAAQHTGCVLIKSQPMTDGRVRVFMQQFRAEPQEPTTHIGLDPAEGFEDQAARWLAAFTHAPQNPSQTGETLSLLLASEAGGWRLEADLERTVLRALQRQLALDDLPKHVASRRWSDAAEGMRWICAVDHLKDLCSQWQPIVADGLKNHYQTAGIRAQTRVSVAGAPTLAHGKMALPLLVWTPTPLRLLWVRVTALDVMDRPVAFESVCEVALGDATTQPIKTTCSFSKPPPSALHYQAEVQDLRTEAP